MDERLTRSSDCNGYHFSGFRFPQNSQTAVGQLVWRGIAEDEGGEPFDVFFRLFVPLRKMWYYPFPNFTYVEVQLASARLKADEMKSKVEAEKEIVYEKGTWTIDCETVEVPARIVKIKSIRWIDNYENGEAAWRSVKS